MGKRLLIAPSADAIDRAQQTFDGYCDYMIAATLQDAISALAQHAFDCIICATQFDDKKMFDLLRHVQADVAHQHIPFIGLQTSPWLHSPSILRSIELAAKSLGAAGFVDIYDWRMSFGDEPAFAQLREYVARHLSPANLNTD